MDRKVVTELIQNDCTTEKITTELGSILTGEEREVMLNDYEKLAKRMGTAGASERTAKLIFDFLR